MKIVEFKDGTYGIRRRFLFHYEYLDLTYYIEDKTISWRRIDSKCIKNCQNKDFDKILDILKELTGKKEYDYGKPLNNNDFVVKKL